MSKDITLRSIEKEQERLASLAARLAARPERIPDAQAMLPNLYRQEGKIWKGGVEPMPFDEFCVKLDGNPMFPRQVQAWDEAGILRANQLLSPTRTITELVLVHGKRSGKDYTAAKFIAYRTFLLHMLAIPPCQYFAEAGNLALAHDTRLDIPNVAPNQDLARQVFFDYLKRFLSNSIFMDWPIYPAINQWKPGTEEIIFPTVNLHLYSKSSESSGLDGFNVFDYLIDEGDAFRREIVEAIHNIFRRTMLSTFGPFGLGINISYPREEEGYMLTLAERARKSPNLFYVDIAATHEIRPDFDINDPIIQEEFDNDPAGAAAMYMCQPMSIEQAFFPFPERITQAVDVGREPIAIWTPRLTKTELKNGEIVEKVGGLIEGIKVTPGHTYFLGGDGGKIKDSFTLAVVHVDEAEDAVEWFCPMCGQHTELLAFATYTRCAGDEALSLDTVTCGRCAARPQDMAQIPSLRGWWHREADGKEAVVHVQEEAFVIPRIVEDLIVEFEPVAARMRGEKNRTVDYGDVQAVAVTLVNTLNIPRARFDPWNCTSIIQAIQEKTGCDAKEISFSNPEQYRRARLVRVALHNHMLALLPNEKRDREWKRLQDLGGKVDHPPNKTGETKEGKDIYDAESVAIWTAATWKCAKLEAEWL